MKIHAHSDADSLSPAVVKVIGGQWKADQKTASMQVRQLVLLLQDIFPSSIGILELRKCSKF